MSEINEWVAVTAIADRWEVEIEQWSGRYRHRPVSFSPERRENWRPGRPPSGVHSPQEVRA